MKAIIVSVSYGDFLSITLPLNCHHFSEILVVTSPCDTRTKAAAAAVDNAIHYETKKFWEDGAIFAKGRAMEEGFDIIGRDGWMVVMDADIVLPNTMDLSHITPGNLYSPYRRLCESQEKYRTNPDWSSLRSGPEHKNAEFAGYFQLFHASDPVLAWLPWYGNGRWWRTAQGCDTDFYHKWPKDNLVRLPWDVLHLGPIVKNWNGRISPPWDPMVPGKEGR